MKDEPAYTINPSALAAHLPVLIRQVLLVVGGALAIVRFLSGHDLAGLWEYLQTDEFVTFAVTASTFGALLYGQWKVHTDRVRLVRIAKAAPDAVSVVIEPSPPPSEPGI